MSLSLNVRDLLNSRKRRSTSEFDVFDEAGIRAGTFSSESEFQWRARTVILSLNYRINQEKKRRGREGGEGYEGGGEEF